MKRFSLLLVFALATMLCSTVAFATEDGNFLIGVVTGLPATDTDINLSNSGQSWGQFISIPSGRLVAGNGNICANVYVFSFDEQEIACCACRVTPNALKSYSVVSDLINNPLTGVPFPNRGAIIKIVATAAITGNAPGATGTAGCDPTLVGVVDNFGEAVAGAQFPVGGLLAWERRGETSNIPLVSSTLSKLELTRVVNLCTNIVGNGTGHGICNFCRNDSE